jgi:hypothetical protein
MKSYELLLKNISEHYFNILTNNLAAHFTIIKQL